MRRNHGRSGGAIKSDKRKPCEVREPRGHREKKQTLEDNVKHSVEYERMVGLLSAIGPGALLSV